MIKRLLLCLLLAGFAAGSLSAQTKKKTTTKKTTTVKKTTTTGKTTAKTQPTAKPIPKPIPKHTGIIAPDPVYAGKTRVIMETEYGNIVIRLYDSTPKHRDNFVKLVEAHFFDSLIFHRVIESFMIQGGDPTSKNAEPGTMLGGGGGDMPRVPAEFHPRLFHKKGVIAGARDGNPEKASSGCQFYIVQGKRFTDLELNEVEKQIGSESFAADKRAARQIPPTQREIYKAIGGSPWLDQNYTVFGEVEKGIEIIDKIAAEPKDGNDRPLKDIRFTIKMMK
jgi:cyclophilin family peptidyl-prolyl cis-trans isomerase